MFDKVSEAFNRLQLRVKDKADAITSKAAASKAGSQRVEKTLGKRQAQWDATGLIALRDSRLKKLPDEVRWAEKARSLDASGNRIAQLPEWLGEELTTLHRLIISRNQLTFLPQQLSGLTQLKVAQLDGNRLTSIPEALLQLPRLESLDISNNEVFNVSPSISKLTSLTSLNLSNNEIGVLPLEIGYCAALQHLDVSSNSLQALPDKISNLLQLRTLSADSNSISDVPPAVLQQCSSLQTLTLHNNPITISALEATEGYKEFDARRRLKYDKVIDGRAMLGSSGFQESVQRAA